MTSCPAFSVVRRFEGKIRDDGVGHGQDAWAALSEKFDGCSREVLGAAHREMQTVKRRSDEDPDDILNKKNRSRDRPDFVTPKKDPSDRQYEHIILQYLPPEHDIIRQTHFEKTDCNLADIRRMMSKIYADNLARSNSDSSRIIVGRGVAMQATGRDLSNIISTTARSSATIRTRRLQGSSSAESATQTKAAQAARLTSAASVEAGGEAAVEGREVNMVLIPQGHHSQGRRLPRQAGERAQRQRPLHPSPSSERSWDLQLVESPCAR